MGRLEKGRSPKPYYMLIILLLVAVFLVVYFYGSEEIEETLGSFITQDAVDSVEMAPLVEIDPELFSGEGRANYVGDEICKQFDQDYIAGMLHRNVIHEQEITNGTSVGCIYHLDNNNDTVTIVLKKGSFINDIRGHELIGRIVEPDDSIAIDNYVVRNGKSDIVEIYLLMTDTRFLQIGMNNTTSESSHNLLDLAIDISKELRIYYLN